MATSSTRQRKLARQKLDRQLARRAEKERRQRQIRAAAAGVLSLALLVVGGMWIGGVFDKESAPLDAAPDCSWTPQDTAANNNLKDVGTPAATGITKTGTSTMSIALKSGDTAGNVNVQLSHDLAKCGTAALTYLAARNFYGETKCHELTHAEGSFALRCGDPSETGNGGAAFTWYPENVPQAPTTPSASPAPSGSPAPSASPEPAAVRYPAGTVAMATGLYGSQFLIFYKDSTVDANYSVVGRVTSGLDVVTKIADAGTVSNANGVDTKPKNDVIIQTLSVTSDAAMPSPDPSASPSPSPTASPSS